MRITITNSAIEGLRSLNATYLATAAPNGVRGKLIEFAQRATDIVDSYPDASTELRGRGGKALLLRKEDLCSDLGDQIVMIAVQDREQPDVLAVIAIVSLPRFLDHHKRKMVTESWVFDSRGAAALRAELARARMTPDDFARVAGVSSTEVLDAARGTTRPSDALRQAAHDKLGIRFALWGDTHVVTLSSRQGHSR